MAHATYIVEGQYTHMRLDRWVQHALNAQGFSHVQRLLRKGVIRVNQKHVSGTYRLMEGDEIRFPESMYIKKQDIVSMSQAHRTQFREMILYEDRYCVVLNKQGGLAVQGGTSVSMHVDMMARDYYRDDDVTPRLVHRIDKETSGLLVVAKDRRTAQRLTGLFKDQKIHKQYWAFVHGCPRAHEGVIDLPISDGKGQVRRIVSETGSPALTEFQRIHRHLKQDIALLALFPKTGRKHQLRVHVSSQGFPIIGDTLYGNELRLSASLKIKISHLYLHARQILIPGEGDGDPLILEAPLPNYMYQLGKRLGFLGTKAI